MSDPSTTEGATGPISVFDHPALLSACMADWFMIGLEMACESNLQYRIELRCVRDETSDGRYFTHYELRVKEVSEKDSGEERIFGVTLGVKLEKGPKSC